MCRAEHYTLHTHSLTLSVNICEDQNQFCSTEAGVSKVPASTEHDNKYTESKTVISQKGLQNKEERISSTLSALIILAGHTQTVLPTAQQSPHMSFVTYKRLPVTSSKTGKWPLKWSHAWKQTKICLDIERMQTETKRKLPASDYQRQIQLPDSILAKWRSRYMLAEFNILFDFRLG